MSDSVIVELLKLGPAGAIIVALAVAYYRSLGEIKELQAARVEDAKKYGERLDTIQSNTMAGFQALQAQRVKDAQDATAQMLRMNSESVTALTRSSNAMEAATEGMSEVKRSLSDFADELRANRRTGR